MHTTGQAFFKSGKFDAIRMVLVRVLGEDTVLPAVSSGSGRRQRAGSLPHETDTVLTKDTGDSILSCLILVVVLVVLLLCSRASRLARGIF